MLRGAMPLAGGSPSSETPATPASSPRIPTSGEPPDSGTRTGGSPLFMLEDMTVQRMDNVAIVVDDLDAAVAFFTELGMELEGKGQVEGVWADPTLGLDHSQNDIPTFRTPHPPPTLD